MYRLFKVFVVAPSICYALPGKTLRHQARRFLLSPRGSLPHRSLISATGRVSASRDCDGATGSFIAR
jgi:hypothetical protein